MNKYYYLKIGDVIKKDDEFCNPDNLFSAEKEMWFSINSWPDYIGKKTTIQGTSKFRRKRTWDKFDSDEQPNWQ